MSAAWWRRLALIAMAALASCSVQDSGKEEADGRVQSRDEFQSRIGTAINPDKHPGKALFAANCAGCHEGGVPKAPNTIWLEMMSPDAILGAMNGGIMSQQASRLAPAERVQIAEYLARISLADYKPPAPPPRCDSPTFAGGPPPAKVGWGHDNRRFVPATVAGLSAAQVTHGLFVARKRRPSVKILRARGAEDQAFGFEDWRQRHA